MAGLRWVSRRPTAKPTIKKGPNEIARAARKTGLIARTAIRRAGKIISLPKSAIGHAWKSRTGRRIIASGLAAGILLAGSGRAQQRTGQIYDSTGSPVQNLIVDRPKLRHSMEKILLHTRGYLRANPLHSDPRRNMMSLFSPSTLAELNRAHTTAEYEAILEKHLTPDRVEVIDYFLEKQYTENPQLQEAVAEISRVKGQRNTLLFFLAGFIGISLLSARQRNK